MDEIERRDFFIYTASLGLVLAWPGVLAAEDAPMPPALVRVSSSTTRVSSYTYVGSLDPKFCERFVGERLPYRIEWQRILGVADITLSCSRGATPDRFHSSYVMELRNVYSTLSRYGKMLIETDMLVGKQQGRYRLMPERTLIEHTFKGDVYRRQYVFDYTKHSYTLHRTKNGVENKNRVYSFRPERVFDDPSTAFYNLRAGIYGAAAPGSRFKVRCLQFAGMRRYEAEALAPQQVAAAADMLKAYPQTQIMLAAKLSKQLFLDKPGGMVYFGFDKQMKPLFGMIPQIPSVGDVYALS